MQVKCLIINSVCGIGSTGRICVDIAEELSKNGHEVKIVYGREPIPDRSRNYAIRIGTDFDVKMHGLKARCFDAAGFGSTEVTKKLIAWIKSYAPDIIHLHNIHGYYINIEILFDYLKNCGKKIIWTLHDCWSFTGHCPYFEFAGCNKWITGCGKCPQIKEYPRSYLDLSHKNWKRKEKIFSSVSNMILVTPSQWLAELVGKSYLSGYPVKVINNSVDTSIFKPTESNIKEENGLCDKKIILGVASEWNYRKGLNYMIDLAGKLGNEYAVVIIGVSEEQKRNLPSNVVGILRTANAQELVKWYSSAAVFVNPTLEDNYPTTNLESIACGTPVITFNSGGSPESARLYGAVVDKGDVDKICQLIRNADFTNKVESLTMESMVKKYLYLYEKT